MKNVQLGEFLTDVQLRQVIEIKKDFDAAERRSAAEVAEASLARRIEREVIRPNLEEINAKLGQENDPAYLAYMLEYVLSTIEES